MNCASCGKPPTTVDRCNNPLGHDFGAGYSGNSATGDVTGWKGIEPTGGDGDSAAVGLVQASSKIEANPCVHCRSFEKNEVKLRQLFASKGFVVHPDGTVTTPIVKDIPGRKSLRIDPKVFGWCRLLTIPVDEQATCGRWAPTAAAARFLGLVRAR